MEKDFIRKRIQEESIHLSKICVRFPPEPNGYLHIGHAKSIVLNFSIAQEFSGICNLRFDDTNPEKEEEAYVYSIRDTLRWLGYTAYEEHYSSDYFGKFYEYARLLIKKECAYVDHSSLEQIRQMRGSLEKKGEESPYRNRSVEENLALFKQMKEGMFSDGECVLRAKISMKNPNMTMRDPTIYRIKHVSHHRTKDTWCIYPMYDFAHCLSDAIEGITHSICTLEFEIHRELYNWFINTVGIPSPQPQQIEFARLQLTHTILSKRYIKMLVDSKRVDSWDDPRLATIPALRRRGYTATSIKRFCKQIGVTKTNAVLEIERLEEELRNHLNECAIRVMVVLNPIMLIITNYPSDKVEYVEMENNPEAKNTTLSKEDNPAHFIQDTKHSMPFSRVLYIERDDFMEDPPKKYFRLSLGKEVRLKHAYYIRCTNVIKDSKENIQEIHAEYDPKSKGGWTDDGRKVRGTLHWVSVAHSKQISVNLYDRLFRSSHPKMDDDSFIQEVNPQSLVRIDNVHAEPYLIDIVEQSKNASELVPLQFVRKAYFVYDEKTSKTSNSIVFNRTVALKDMWRKDHKKA